MRGVHDEKLVFHVRERFVVDNLLNKAHLGLGRDSLNGGRPCVQSHAMEGVWEEIWALVARPEVIVVVFPHFQ